MSRYEIFNIPYFSTFLSQYSIQTNFGLLRHKNLVNWTLE